MFSNIKDDQRPRRTSIFRHGPAVLASHWRSDPSTDKFVCGWEMPDGPRITKDGAFVMFPKSDHRGRIIWRDIVPIAAFALALLLTFWTRPYSDMPPNSLPTHASIQHRAASDQRWTTVWPTVVRFDRPVVADTPRQ